MSGEFFLAIELWRICLLWLEFLSHRRQSHLNCTCNALSTQLFFPYQSISTWKHMKWKENVYKRHLNYLIYYWNILLTDWIFKKTYSLFFSTHLRFWSLPVWYQKVLHVYDFFSFRNSSTWFEQSKKTQPALGFCYRCGYFCVWSIHVHLTDRLMASFKVNTIKNKTKRKTKRRLDICSVLFLSKIVFE